VRKESEQNDFVTEKKNAGPSKIIERGMAALEQEIDPFGILSVPMPCLVHGNFLLCTMLSKRG
jgi:hypothetical protein